MPVFSRGNTVAVFRFKIYDITKDEFVLSKRLARPHAINGIGAQLAGPSYEVPADDVDNDGFTAIGYEPPDQKSSGL